MKMMLESDQPESRGQFIGLYQFYTKSENDNKILYKGTEWFVTTDEDNSLRSNSPLKNWSLYQLFIITGNKKEVGGGVYLWKHLNTHKK